MAQGKRAKRAVIVSRRARHSRGSPGSFVRAKDALSQDDRGFSVGCLCWGRLKGSEPNARLLCREERDTSRGSPGSFVRAKDALSQDDRGFSVGCLCWGRLKGSEPNARLLR